MPVKKPISNKQLHIELAGLRHADQKTNEAVSKKIEADNIKEKKKLVKIVKACAIILIAVAINTILRKLGV